MNFQNAKQIQLLLFVKPEDFQKTVEFYETVLGLSAFYGWNDTPEDCGRKYSVGGTVLVVLVQEHPFGEPIVPVNYQIEVENADAAYDVVVRRAPGCSTMGLFNRPYGWRMFRIKDPAGNHINIYHIPEETI